MKPGHSALVTQNPVDPQTRHVSKVSPFALAASGPNTVFTPGVLGQGPSSPAGQQGDREERVEGKYRTSASGSQARVSLFPNCLAPLSPRGAGVGGRNSALCLLRLLVCSLS